jgi:hypothetical protein
VLVEIRDSRVDVVEREKIRKGEVKFKEVLWNREPWVRLRLIKYIIFFFRDWPR